MRNALAAVALCGAATVTAACEPAKAAASPADPQAPVASRFTLPAVPAPKAASTPQAQAVARGEYLVDFGGCNDCHTPKVKGPHGLVPDTSRLLSGHPASRPMPAPPSPRGPWTVSTNADTTAWAGPWGVTYASNLTSDVATGLGQWTADDFVEAMRTGQARGEPILPPMPWQNVGKLTDDDLRALFAYLRSIPPIRNAVPMPREERHAR